jgi:hypothetical protein
MNDEDLGDDDPVVARVAKAIYDTHVQQARAKAAAHDVQLDRLRRVFLKAREESDRSAAILIFALAEDLMLDGLKANMNSKVKGGWAAVTDANGVLATASDRIMLLQLLFWVRDRTCEDLRLLKSIRNRFAHHADVESFSDSKIAGWISSLSRHEEPVFSLYPDDVRRGWRTFSPRELYLMRACAAVTQLASDLAVGPAARAERVDPRHVVGQGYDALPENLKAVTRLSAEVFLAFFPPLKRNQ